MPPMPRKPGARDLPPNLYNSTDARTGAVYFRYRDPRTGKFHGLGSDKTGAIADARALNAAIYQAVAQLRRTEIVTPAVSGPTVAELVRRYWTIITRERSLKPNTVRSRTYITDRIIASMGALKAAAVTVHDCANLLNTYVEQDKNRMAQSVRAVLVDLFAVAASEGLRADNPATLTRQPVAKVRRTRLTLDDFNAILAVATGDDAWHGNDPWIANSMLLALVTGQRREDCGLVRFRDLHHGWLHIEQGKTGARIKIAATLRLEAIGLSVQDVVERCRDNVVSPYLLHHTVARTHAKRGAPVHKDTISRGFARVREASGLTWEGKPPTFHEIRSLSGRLYKTQGLDAQKLLGHTDARMTDTYLNDRGREWTEIG